MNRPADMDQQLIIRWIDPNGRKPGPADAWVLPVHVPVWAVISQLQLDNWDVAGVAEDYDLPREAVEAAMAYYRLHQTDVDARIERNNAHFAGL